MLKKTLLLLTITFIHAQGWSQVYTEKQTRHRFAQLNLGVDFEMSLGGKTSYLNAQSAIETVDLESIYKPRILIGGTHFWGHTDIVLAIPLFHPTLNVNNQEVQYLRGVETIFKFYPWRIEHNKVRPFVGFSLAPFYFEQKNNNLNFGNGAELAHTSFPLLTGLTFNNKNNLFSIDLAWNYNNTKSYFLNREITTEIDTPPFYLNVGYKRMLDTTQSAEEGWESGKTKEITDKLAAEGRLNSLFIGVGMSSAFWLGQSSYNTENHPFLENYGISLMPDFTLGYYFNNADINIGVSYRGYGTSTNAYGIIQSLKRRSFVLEASKYLFDYHGFVPFVGPILSSERLSFAESFEGNLAHNITENQLTYGVVFGWDIRPNRLQSWILRTNLRWFPDLQLPVESNNAISFNNIEFNFIQLIIYPKRFFGKW